MKYFVKFIVVTLSLIICTHSFAEQKIVVLDLKFVLNNSKAGKGAQDYLKKSFKDNNKKFSDMEKALKKEENGQLTKKTVLSKEDYTKKTDTLRKKVIDYQSQRRAAIDKIAAQRTEYRETLIKETDKILKTYIKENNITLVIEKKGTLGGNPTNDITSVIVEKLNKEFPKLNLN